MVPTSEYLLGQMHLAALTGAVHTARMSSYTALHQAGNLGLMLLA